MFTMLYFKNSKSFLSRIDFLVTYLNRSLNFHTSCSLSATKQMGNTMKKVLNGNSSKKKVYYHETISNPGNAFTKAPVRNNMHPRRAVVLDKLFMRNITDLMSTGEYASLILGFGVEVSKAKITHDYKILKVYWTATTSKLEEVEEILHKSAGLLRHELSTLRLMGHVPVIQFVKDKNSCQLVELDRRLSIADYGEEGPSNTDLAAHFLSEFELVLPLEKNIKKEIDKLEKQNPYEEEELQLPEVLPMTNCVFDLDHEAIMNRIKKASSKTRYNTNITGDENWASFKLKQYSNSDPLVLGDDKLQREAFNKFLQQRQFLKNKEKKIRDDLAFFQDEQIVESKNMNFPENTEEDFIEEDIYEKNDK